MDIFTETELRLKFLQVLLHSLSVVHSQWFQSGSRDLISKNDRIFHLKKLHCIASLKTARRTSKPHKKPTSLKREDPALQNVTFLHIFIFCYRLDRDPDDQKKVRIYADPDPKHCIVFFHYSALCGSQWNPRFPIRFVSKSFKDMTVDFRFLVITV
jgi:hypothetical protein